MELEELVGEHELSGIDEINDAFIFILDGITYKAVEDPDDGYRSYLDELIVCDDKVSNIFTPQKVIGKMSDDGNDFIQFIDAINGKCVLEIGTDSSDTYYPYCVMSWIPENLHCNS